MIDGITGWITGMLTAEGSVVVLIVLFIIFIVAAKKLLKILLNYFLIGIAGAIFPFFAQLVGINITLSIGNVIYFASSAMLLYSIYLFANVVYKFLSGMESVGRKITGSNERKIDKLQKKVKKLEKEKSASD